MSRVYRKIEKANKCNTLKSQEAANVVAKLNKVDEQVLAALKAGKELPLQELTEITGQPSKKVFKSLRKLFENGMIDTKARKYKLIDPSKANLEAKDVSEEI